MAVVTSSKNKQSEPYMLLSTETSSVSEPAHRLLDDLDVRSQYVQPRPPVFFNSISGPLLDNLIWTNIRRRGLWLWTLYHCNLCNLNVALNKMMMMMMITWIHYVSKKYRRQADRKVILLIGAWGTKSFSFIFDFSLFTRKKYSHSMHCMHEKIIFEG